MLTPRVCSTDRPAVMKTETRNNLPSAFAVVTSAPLSINVFSALALLCPSVFQTVPRYHVFLLAILGMELDRYFPQQIILSIAATRLQKSWLLMVDLVALSIPSHPDRYPQASNKNRDLHRAPYFHHRTQS